MHGLRSPSARNTVQILNEHLEATSCRRPKVCRRRPNAAREGQHRPHLKPFFAGRVAAIRRVDIQRYVTKRSGDDVSAHTIQNELSHDLRHTAASRLRMSGADIHTVAQLLGHKDLRMASRYQHLSPSFLVEAVGKLDAVFGCFVTETLPRQNSFRSNGA